MKTQNPNSETNIDPRKKAIITCSVDVWIQVAKALTHKILDENEDAFGPRIWPMSFIELIVETFMDLDGLQLVTILDCN